MAHDDNEAIDVDAERRASLSDAIDKALMNAPSARPTFNKQRRKAFIELLAAGLTFSQSARTVGLTASYLHHLRRLDPAFDEACVSAIELGTDPVVERLTAIALHGDPGSMATVRAAETVLKGRNAAYRDRSGSVRIERRDADGNTWKLSAGTSGIPD